jgi:sugar lactone lactonase YvrE
MPDLLEQLGRYGTALESHQGTSAPQPVRPRSSPPRRRTRLTVMIAAALLIVGLAVSLITFSTDRDSGRITTATTVTGASTTAPPTTAAPVALNRPEALAVTTDGSLLIANQGTDQILRRTPDGKLVVVAGISDPAAGPAPWPDPGYLGDDGPATDARLARPSGMAVATDGTIYFADQGNNRVRAIAPDGRIRTVAGDGTDGPGASGVPATTTAVAAPVAVALRADGGIYIVDAAGVQVVSPAGILTTVLAQGMNTLKINGEFNFFFPDAIAVDHTGSLFVSNFSPKLLVEFSPTGEQLRVWDSYYVTQAGLATAPNGSILLAGYGEFAIDRLRDGTVSTVAAFTRDKPLRGVSGTFRPSGVAVAASGTIYASTDGVSGTTDAPALIAITPNARPEVLPVIPAVTTTTPPAVTTTAPAASANTTATTSATTTVAPVLPSTKADHPFLVARIALGGGSAVFAIALGLLFRRRRWVYLVPPAIAVAFIVSYGLDNWPRFRFAVVWAGLVDVVVFAASRIRRTRPAVDEAGSRAR